MIKIDRKRRIGLRTILFSLVALSSQVMGSEGITFHLEGIGDMTYREPSIFRRPDPLNWHELLAKHTSSEEIEIREENARFNILPSTIGMCTNLKALTLVDDNLLRLCPQIGMCTALTTLNLFKNNLSSLPTQIGLCTALTNLNLDRNIFDTLPSEIGMCTNLTKLTVGSYELFNLPTELGSCSALISLSIEDQGHFRLFPEIKHFTSLTYLQCRGKQSTYISTDIGYCTSLKELNLGMGKLTEIPTEIGNCVLLEEINLYGNKLTGIPMEIGNLPKLKKLHVDSNPLKEVLTKKMLKRNNSAAIFKIYCQYVFLKCVILTESKDSGSIMFLLPQKLLKKIFDIWSNIHVRETVSKLKKTRYDY